jgi:hypothetical protein
MKVSRAEYSDTDSLEAWEEPDDELVSQVLIRLGDMQHRRIFYEGLENPQWVKKLAARKVFDAVPDMTVDSTGRLRSRIWPEGEYLARMAALAPDLVTPILERLAATDNYWVQRIIVSGVANMSAGHARRLVRFIVKYLNNPYRFYLEPGKLVGIAETLQAGGNTGGAMELLNALYRPRGRSSGEQRIIRGQDVEAGLSDDAYERWLPESIPTLIALGGRGLGAAVGWLVEYERVSRYSEHLADDISHIWRPSIASHEEPRMGDEIGHALVDAVLETAHGCINRGTVAETVLAKLESTSECLLRRIVLEFLAQLVNRSQELTDDVCRPAMVRLLDRKSLGAGLWREYANLARAILSKAQAQHVSEWAAFARSVEVYPDESGIREILASSDRNLADVTNEEIVSYRNRRRLDLLATVGRDWLPDSLLEEFDRLVADYGLPQHPGQPGGVEILPFVGPTSPVSQAELAALEIDELLNYLKSWRPIVRGLWGPSVAGLARTVEQLVRADPGKFANRAWDMHELPIAYVRAAVAGWRDALQRDVAFSTEEIWRLAAFVACQPDDGAEQDARTYGAETVWRYSQQEVARLVSAYLRQGRERELPIGSVKLLWDTVKPLTCHADPTPEREGQAISGGMDPLTLSLNSTRPIAIRTTAHLLNALDRHGMISGNADFVTELLDSLAEHIGPSADPSLAIAATLGEVMGALISAAPHWVSAHANAMFGGIKSVDPAEQAWSDTLFSVTVAAYGPSRTLLEHLRPWFEETFTPSYMDREKAVGWHVPQSAAEHVAGHILQLYVHGVIEQDDPLVQLLFSATTAQARGAALGHVGWQFLHDDREEAIKARAQHLVEWRAQEIRVSNASAVELNGFHWWVRSSRFPADWWLPILELAVRNSAFDPHSSLGTALAVAAHEFPRQTASLLSQLLPVGEPSWQRFDLIESAPAILAAALDSGDDVAHDIAMTVMNRLGREGHTDLNEAIGRHRAKTA